LRKKRKWREGLLVRLISSQEEGTFYKKKKKRPFHESGKERISQRGRDGPALLGSRP